MKQGPLTVSQLALACQVAWNSNWQEVFVVKAHIGSWPSIQQHAPISGEVPVVVVVVVEEEEEEEKEEEVVSLHGEASHDTLW